MHVKNPTHSYLKLARLELISTRVHGELKYCHLEQGSLQAQYHLDLGRIETNKLASKSHVKKNKSYLGVEQNQLNHQGCECC